MTASETPKIFRITLEVADIEAAATFYAALLAMPGKRHPGARHYFDCGGVILAVLDPTRRRHEADPGAQVALLRGPRPRRRPRARGGAGRAGAVQGARRPGRRDAKRPWGERSFYVTDPWGNELCFVQEGTLYT